MSNKPGSESRRRPCQVSFRLTDEELHRLEEAAKARGRVSRSDFVRSVVLEALRADNSHGDS